MIGVVLQERPVGAPPWTAFVVAVALTLVALLFAIWTGRTARRRLHVVTVCFLVPVLATAIYFAETVGSYWVFPAVPLQIHLGFAYTASAATLLAVGSGIAHIRGWVRRSTHAPVAWFFVAAAVGAVATGTWIFLVGSPRV